MIRESHTDLSDMFRRHGFLDPPSSFSEHVINLPHDPPESGAFILLSRFLRPLPIVLSVPPQAEESGTEFRGRFGGP
jgi:hypothetical protein